MQTLRARRMDEDEGLAHLWPEVQLGDAVRILDPDDVHYDCTGEVLALDCTVKVRIDDKYELDFDTYALERLPDERDRDRAVVAIAQCDLAHGWVKLAERRRKMRIGTRVRIIDPDSGAYDMVGQIVYDPDCILKIASTLAKFGGRLVKSPFLKKQVGARRRSQRALINIPYPLGDTRWFHLSQYEIV